MVTLLREVSFFLSRFLWTLEKSLTMLNRFISNFVTVKDKGNIIEITGAPAETLERLMRKHWETGKISKNMFLRFSRWNISFYAFYAIEFSYILDELLTHRKKDAKSLLAVRVMEQLRVALKEETWLSGIAQDHPSIYDLDGLKEIKYAPLPHQRRAMAWYDHVKLRYRLRGILLPIAAGGGKTICSLTMAFCLRADNIIIISPKNAIYKVWEDTVINALTRKHNYWIADRGGKPNANDKIHIYHYEALDKHKDNIQKLKGRTVVILDESHNFNDPKSTRTKNFFEVCHHQSVTDVIELSGTPIKAMGSDSIPLLKVIDPMFTPEVEESFKKIFGKDAKKANDILANRLGIVSYKVTKDEFMPSKPIEENIRIKLDGGEYYTLEKIGERMTAFVNERVKYYKDRRKEDFKFYEEALTKYYEPQIKKGTQEYADYREYEKYVTMFVKQGFDAKTMKEESIFCNDFEKRFIMPKLPQALRARFKDVKSAVKYPELKIRGEALGRILGRERIEANVRLARAVDYQKILASAEKKVICFSSHVEVIEAAYEVQKSKGMSPLKVSADTNKFLPQIVRDFGSKQEINPLNATYQSLSTAVPLTMANVIVALNTPFRIHEMEQAIARAWRIGQDSQVYVYYVVLDTGDKVNISSRSADIMQWSKEQVDSIMGFESDRNVDLEDGVVSMESLNQPSGYEIGEDLITFESIDGFDESMIDQPIRPILPFDEMAKVVESFLKNPTAQTINSKFDMVSFTKGEDVPEVLANATKFISGVKVNLTDKSIDKAIQVASTSLVNLNHVSRDIIHMKSTFSNYFNEEESTQVFRSLSREEIRNTYALISNWANFKPELRFNDNDLGNDDVCHQVIYPIENILRYADEVCADMLKLCYYSIK